MKALHADIAVERVTLVTPNRRLAAYHKREFDRAQLNAGLTVWPTPDILPFPAFVERTWHGLMLRAEPSTRSQLLDSAQSQLLWEQVVRKSAAASVNGLMNVAQAARQAASAWTLARAWHLLPAMHKFPLHDDAAMFLAWTQRYHLLCREKLAIDGAEVTDALAEMLAAGVNDENLLPMRILTVGFDIVPPQQHHLWRMFAEAGIEVRVIGIERGGPQPKHTRLAFAAETDEVRACAAWARQKLEQDSCRRVAIVVPDLQVRRSAIARELTDALLPEVRAGDASADASRSALFNFSLGLPLGDYALVRDALALLAFSQLRAMPFLAVSALLRSPFIAAAEQEQAARAILDARLRQTAAPEMSLAALRKTLSNDARLQGPAGACVRLCEQLDRVAALADSTLTSPARGKSAPPSPSSPPDWSRHFGAVLTAWGFPGERPLDSIDFQVLAKFRDAMASLASLASVQSRMRADEALSQLRRIVADTPFQPEGENQGEAPIQVLGILESAGQSFDALWVMGLSADAWPLVARPNPFIPAALQRSAGVPEASATASLALDRRITAGWMTSAMEVVVSHLTPEEDSLNECDRGASALIADIPLSALTTLLPQGVSVRYAAALQALRVAEPIPDLPMASLPAPTAVRGGAVVIRDQAACPFRAFARHRFAAKPLEAPQPGLDAAERGTLLHRVLYLVWAELGDHESLKALDAGGTARVVAAAAKRAVADAHTKGAASLTGHFAAIEQARLVRVVSEWLEYECERAPFVVVEREALRSVALGGLTMELRLDRLDRLADSTHALIDYKTGVAKLASWLGDRPDEPQLPLYYHTAHEEISALAFARVKRGVRGKTFGFEGVSVVEGLLPDVGPIEEKTRRSKHSYASWDELTKAWEVSLAALAAGFVDGDAKVDPKLGGQTCKQCDLQSVCRVAELAAYATLDGEATPIENDNE